MNDDQETEPTHVADADGRVKPGPGESYPPELRDAARAKREHDPAHWTHKRIAADLGVSEKAVARWTSRDGKPKPRGRPKGTAGKKSPQNVRAQTAAIETALSELLTFPAIPATMLAPTPEGRAFLAAHFTAAGPRTAHTLAVASEQSTELRELLESLTKGSLRATIAFAVISYAGPPLLWLFGMKALAIGVSQAGGLSEDELAAMFQAQNHAPDTIVTEPPEPDAAPEPPAPVEPPAAG